LRAEESKQQSQQLRLRLKSSSVVWDDSSVPGDGKRASKRFPLSDHYAVESEFEVLAGDAGESGSAGAGDSKQPDTDAGRGQPICTDNMLGELERSLEHVRRGESDARARIGRFGQRKFWPLVALLLLYVVLPSSGGGVLAWLRPYLLLLAGVVCGALFGLLLATELAFNPAESRNMRGVIAEMELCLSRVRAGPTGQDKTGGGGSGGAEGKQRAAGKRR
jgi:hypothetical protein